LIDQQHNQGAAVVVRLCLQRQLLHEVAAMSLAAGAAGKADAAIWSLSSLSILSSDTVSRQLVVVAVQ